MKIVLAAVIVLGAVTFAYAQMNMTDSVTITTYYPSPYGSYRQLEVRRGLTYRPLSATPAPSKDDREGEMIYVDANPNDTNPGEFYFRGGKQWVPQSGGGGGGVCYTNYGTNSCASDYTLVVDGYVTAYLARAAGSGAEGMSLQCSSITHTGSSNVYFTVGSTNGNGVGLDLSTPERCAVCCK